MAFKNIYRPKEKEKNIYSSSGAANSSRTAAANTRSTPQNNVWNAEESTPGPQSYTPQNRKREKSPSELGKEVVRVMLEDYAQEQQRQAAAGSAVQHSSGVARMKAAGNRETAQYGDAAGRSGRAALYNSPSAVKPAVGNQKATPYGGTATAPYSSPAAAKPAIQNRKKSPSELGEEAVRTMLEDEGLLELSEPEEKEAPAARTFTTGVGRSDIIGADAYAARNAAPGNGFSAAAGNAGEDTGPTPATPEELMLAAAPDFAAAGIDTSVLQAGLTLADKIEQFTPEKANQLALDWLPLLSTPDLYDPGLAAAANQFGLGLADKIEQFTPDKANQFASDWLDLMSMSNSDYPGLPAAANQFGLGLKEAAAQFTPDKANSLALDWLDLMSMSNSDYPGLPMFANPVSPLLKNGTEPLWNTTHLAADTQAPKLEIHDLQREPQSNRAESESEALPKEEKSDTVKEWWEIPGASEPIDPDDPTYQAKNAELTDKQRAAGLSVVKINGEYYVDITTMINTRLQEVEQDFRNHFIDFQNSSSHNEEFMLANTAWFISQVKGNGPWDIKVVDSWEKQFGDILELKDMSKTFAYNGQVVTPENLGNLTYGYLGRSMGWPAETLYLAGGIYNQFNLAAEKIVEAEKTPTREGRMDPALFYLYNILRPSVYSDGSYGDGENDYEFVKKGVELYEAVH